GSAAGRVMAKYTRRDYQVGDWWLGQRDGSAAYYGFRYDPAKRRTERVSLGTTELERAQQKLTELHLRTRVPEKEEPREAFLADVLRRYWEAHASKARSAQSNRHCINVWLDFWKEASVEVLADVSRQEAFHAYMRERGFSPAGM